MPVASWNLHLLHDAFGIWALLDLNTFNPGPSSATIIEPDLFFVVTAASPCFDLEWIKKYDFCKFYMKPWSISELFQVYVDSISGDSQPSRSTFCSRSFFGKKTTERQLWDFYNTFRASPGSAATYAHTPAHYESLLKEAIATEATPDQVRAAIDDPGSVDLSHFIVTIFPSGPDSTTFRTTISSKYVFNLLWEKLYHT